MPLKTEYIAKMTPVCLISGGITPRAGTVQGLHVVGHLSRLFMGLQFTIEDGEHLEMSGAISSQIRREQQGIPFLNEPRKLVLAIGGNIHQDRKGREIRSPTLGHILSQVLEGDAGK